MRAIVISLLIVMGAAWQGAAQDFVYQPKNPAFGGETFNYQWMLSGANAQNGYTDPDRQDPFADRFADRDPLQDFQDQLNRQILNQISSSIIGDQFNNVNGIDDGTYVFGNYQIDVTTTNEGISVVIVDNATGNSTEVVVPIF